MDSTGGPTGFKIRANWWTRLGVQLGSDYEPTGGLDWEETTSQMVDSTGGPTGRRLRANLWTRLGAQLGLDYDPIGGLDWGQLGLDCKPIGDEGMKEG